MKIDKIIFAIIALVFIGGGILLYNDYKNAVETREKVKQEYIEHQKETKEIIRPEQCEHTTTIQAVIDLKLNNGSCWYDSYDYTGSVYDKKTIVWFTCADTIRLPNKLGEFVVTDSLMKLRNIVYKYECKWNNYAPVKNGLGEIVKEANK